MTSNPLSNIPPIGPMTGVAAQAQPSKFRPIDPVRVIREHLWYFIAAGVVGVVLGIGAYFALRATFPLYTSQAQLEVRTPQTGIDIGIAEEANEDIVERRIQTQIVRIRSEEVLRDALTKPIVQQTTWYQSFDDPTERRESLADDLLDVSMLRGTSMINMAVSTPVQSDATRVLNAVMEVYLQKMKLQQQGENTQLRRVFREELERTEIRIRQIQEELKQFASQQQLDSLTARESAAAQEYRRLIEQEIELRLALDSLRAQHESQKEAMQIGTLNASAEQLAEIELNPLIQSKANRVSGLREQRRALLARFGEQHWMVRQLDDQIAAVDKEKQLETDRLLREAQASKVAQTAKLLEIYQSQVSDLQPQLEAAQARMTDLQNTLQSYEQLVSDLETAKEDRQRYNERLDALRVTEQRPDAVTVELAVPPTEPEMTFPDPKVIVPGTMVLLVGLVGGIIFLRELLDQRLKSPADVKVLGETDLLGVIPASSEDPSGEKPIERIVEREPSGLMAESFRKARTAILSKMDRRGYKTLVVVGPSPNCGASTVSHNLATSFALNGRRVVIVDLNFRRPRLHRVLEVSGETGVAEVLGGQATLDEALQPMEGLSLSVLPTGDVSRVAPESIESPAFRAMLGELETRFDTVIIDAAPALLTSDTQLLSKQVDAIAIVVRAGSDKRGMVGRMLRQLDGQRADLLGVVLNGVESSAGGYFRKSYEEFYRYSNDDAARAAKGKGVVNGNGRGAAPRRDAGPVEAPADR